MKSFTAGIAALFLATGTAHAYPPRYYDCDEAFLKIQVQAGTLKGERVFPATWTIREKPEKYRDNRPLNFRCNVDEKCWLNHKFCRSISEEKGHQEFRDEKQD